MLFATAVISVALALMSFFSNTSAPLSNLAGIITSPFRSAYTAVANWFVDKQNYYQDVTALEEENAALKRENAQLQAQLRQAQTDSEENARLRELLNLRPQNYDLELESASVTERTVTNWTSSLTLNVGTDHGVEAGDCVIDETYAWWAWSVKWASTGAPSSPWWTRTPLSAPGVPHQGPGAGGGGLHPDA